MLILPFFFIGGPDWASSALYRAAWNLGHIVFFGLLTLVIQLHWGVGGWRQFLGISALVFVLGLGIEALQLIVGRHVDWGDILRNLVGAWLVLVWRRSRLPTWLLWAGRVAATALLLAQLETVANAAAQRIWMANQLPLLSNLDDPRALKQWHGNVARTRLYSSTGEYSLALRLSTDRYSGAGLVEMPQNWRNYQNLNFKLYNPASETLTLTLRINDIAHDRGSNAYDDRFNSRLVAKPGWNSYRINLKSVKEAPTERTMNMGRIRRLMLFTSGLPQPVTVYLDDLRLE